MLEGLLGFLALDLAIYAQHVAFHKVPWLWRLHRMHHADLDIDVTTGLRFHPIEILLSMLIKMAVVVLVGVPATAVIVFEVVLNATSMFNHANGAMPPWLDRIMRLLVVTPDMHRVHHSVLRHETDSNFGFNLPWWDRLFRTYRAAPEAGHDGMTIGLPVFRDPKELRLDRLLSQPFREDSACRVEGRAVEIRSRIGRRARGPQVRYKRRKAAAGAQTEESDEPDKARGRDRRQEPAVHRQGISRIPARRPRGLHLRRAGERRHRASGVPQLGALDRAALRLAARSRSTRTC